MLSKDSHVSKVALTSLHDIIAEFLKRRNELYHFWFYSDMFKPFEILITMSGVDHEMQDQVSTNNRKRFMCNYNL